jgi:hypothetical protein
MTSIVEAIKEYSPKLENGDLIDKTLSEMKKETGCKIMCPCKNGEYKLTHGSIMKHFESDVHKKWLQKQKNEHVKTYGHFSSTSEIINFVLKENRELKKRCSIQAVQIKHYESTFSELSRNMSECKLKSSIVPYEYESESEGVM